MITIDELDLRTIIEGKQYKIVIDGPFESPAYCEKCALSGLMICSDYACSSAKHDLDYHYEEIPK